MKQMIIYLITLLLLMVVGVYLGYCIGYVLYFLHDTPPCKRDGKVCEKKHPGCQDTCDNPEYLEAMRLCKLRDQDSRRRREATDYDVKSALRRRHKHG